MESEEFEQIPWANLVAQQTDGVDRRLYIAAGVIGLIVVVAFGARFLGGGAQPTPPPVSVLEMPVAPVVGTQANSPTPATSMVIAEADLRIDEPVDADLLDRFVEVRAEWFVTDWFTRDGSDETIRSIERALAPGVATGDLPHTTTPPPPVTFVEWARAYRTEAAPDGRLDVTVAYRAIRETGDGFVREPVRIVVVSLTRDGDLVFVTALPMEVDG
ncbi:MAG: hypothetical protein QGD89_00095 [Actinomycetota bacterium]|nr:hypothetical protein [Actinomycetota bacterium]